MKPDIIVDYADKIDKLGELAEIQYDELGELWEILVTLWNHQDYFISPGFLQSVMDEIDAQLDNVTQNAQLEVIEETEKRTYKHLRW